jgi:hypothetical protein
METNNYGNVIDANGVEVVDAYGRPLTFAEAEQLLRDGYEDASGRLWPSEWHAVAAGAVVVFGRDPETGARVQLSPTKDGGYERRPAVSGVIATA